MTKVEFETLAWINKVRSILGLGSIAYIRPGYRGAATNCPISRSISVGTDEYRVSIGINRLIITDKDGRIFSEPYTNAAVQAFRTEFDTGSRYRHYALN